MSRWQIVGLLFGAGLGTYLLRYLPMRWFVLLQDFFERPRLKIVLGALGPAAIVALLVVSLKGLAVNELQQVEPFSVGRIFLALVAIWFMHKRYQNTMLATLVGVAVYGVLVWLQHQ